MLLCVLRCDLSRIPGGSGHCDVRTAYNFGGPLWTGGSEPDVAAFERDWDGMLHEWGAVTEFMRLHPFRHTVVPSYSVSHFNDHVVDLTQGYKAARARYYGSWRRDLQRAERLQLEVVVSTNPDKHEVGAFELLYALTMERLGAPLWYRFSARTVAGLFALDDVSMVTAYAPSGEPAALGCLLRSGPQLFYHLSAADPAHRELHPTHLMLDAMVRAGCARGCEYLHLGGGALSLQKFKSRLASGSVPYYIVKRVLDEDIYASICAMNDLPIDGEVFPAWLGAWSNASQGAHD